MSLPTKSCHNCRRQRLRCDRSLPQCHKCTSAGQECLGYQALLIWTPQVASRKKMLRMTYQDVKPQQLKQTRPGPEPRSFTSAPPNQDIATTIIPDYPLKSVTLSTLDHSNQMLRARRKVPFKHNINLPLCQHLTEPFFQDLNQDTRFYISYFSRNVCQDLVIYDIPKQNLFRDLIPLAAKHAVLLNIIVANSALHMSNASQRCTVRPVSVGPGPSPNARAIPQHLIPRTNRLSSCYKDALVAKHRALRFLNSALDDVDSIDIDVALGSVLLFIEFELADSSTTDWKLHMHGARALINSVKESYKPHNSNMSSLRRFLISNCLVYDVLGSAFAHSRPSEFPPCSSAIVVSSLRYAEANNYLSFPAILLETVLAAAQLSQRVQDSSPARSVTSSQEHQILSLLYTAQSFDALNWASTIQDTSPHCDLESRAHIASAHKSAVCIYISRVLLLLSPSTEVHDKAELLVSDIINHLSFVTSNSELFKATSWPTFVAGAEAKDLGQQGWAMERLHALWERLPCTMGYVRSAMEILENIWNKRDAAGATPAADWVQDLKMSEIDCMIA